MYDDILTDVDEISDELENGGYPVRNAVDTTPNRPPAADAGQNSTVVEGEVATLDGSGSEDPDGDEIEYLWTRISGPAVILSDSESEQASFRAPEVGEDGGSIVFELLVTDSTGQESSDRITVYVSDLPIEHHDVAALEAKEMIDADPSIKIVDVRGETDYCAGHIPGAVNYPWSTGFLEQRYGDFDAADVLLIVCNLGSTSDLASEFLVSQGFENVYDMSDGMNAWQWETSKCEYPPTASAGTDQTVSEGGKITLDGSGSFDLNSQIVSYTWSQTGGVSALSWEYSGTGLSFVAPPVGTGGSTLRFTLTVANSDGLSDTDEFSVTVTDNGTTVFSDDVLPLLTTTGRNIGIRMDCGCTLAELDALDPATVADNENRPDDLIYGLVKLNIMVDSPGASSTYTLVLPEPAPEGYKLYKHDENSGWSDFSANSVFNADRTQITVTITDGGTGDSDGVADGMICDPSGLGIIEERTSEQTSSSDDDGGGGSGCFISDMMRRTF